MKKHILAIIGSASDDSSNEKIVAHLINKSRDKYKWTIYTNLKKLPHFDPNISTDNTPKMILELRELISKADALIISTPEYVYSIPSGLKNAIEWCVATTVFTDKPVGLITASTDGGKAHEELILIMNTLMAKISDETSLLISGVKSKINSQGQIIDASTEVTLDHFIQSFDTVL